jgi:SEC-C motif-containing protein
MRSRYSAYTKRLPAYLLRTWDPLTRPDELSFDLPIEWTGLEVLSVSLGGPDDDTGTVEFRAHHRHAGRTGVLHERSRFRRVDGAWCYVDGDAPEQPPTGAG